jgi:hypothetical protein
MSEEIKDVKLSFSCNENWEAMADATGGKHCDKYRKKVYDFTNSKADEFFKVLAENNNRVCGRFNASQMASTIIVLPLWKKWLSAAMLLAGINLFGCKGNAQKQTLVGDTVASASFDTTNNVIQADTCQKDIKGEVIASMPIDTNAKFTASPNEISPQLKFYQSLKEDTKSLSLFYVTT